MRVVVVDCNLQGRAPHPVLVEIGHRLRQSGVDLQVDSSWTASYAAADLAIAAHPIADHPTLCKARLVGQRTMNRRQRMEAAQATGAPVARFASPRDEPELTELGRAWDCYEAILKYDWSSRRNGVLLWPLADDRPPLPSDYRPESDLFMELLEGDPLTYKVDAFGGTILNGWILPTRSIRSQDWQVIDDPQVYPFEPPPEVAEAVSEVSLALLRWGVGYASFDLMNGPSGYKIIEINSCGVGTTVWNDWPTRYAETYATAIFRALQRLDAIPLYRDLREAGTAAGNDREAPTAVRSGDAPITPSPPRGDSADEPLPKLFYETLGITEQMPQEELGGVTRRALEALVVHAAESVPLYRDRLARQLKDDGIVAWDRWPELPFTTRDDIRDRRVSLLSRSVPPIHGSIGFIRTRGTSGVPVAISRTKLAIIAQQAIEARYFAWHDVEIASPMVTTLSTPAGRSRWAPPWLPLPHGYLHRWHGGTSEELLNWLRDLGPVHLRTTPSQAQALALTAARQPHLSPSLLSILTYGETLTDEARQLCREHLGHDPRDAYGTVETGLLALRCPASEGYHLQSEITLIEILDADGLACSPGTIGEVVVTPLYNFAMPLIRYRTGDLVEAGDTLDISRPCACGRLLPTIRRIVGRQRELAGGSLERQANLNS